jgi:NAD(P)-dependent dehydrogenase (short-subunit alcohol dehydrogenase family)
MPERRFDGKVALVTGGGSGIGEACVRRLADEGATVVVVDIDAAGAERVAADAASDGAAAASFFVGDVSDPDQAAAAVEHAVTTHGRLHAAVNNAGISGPLVSTEEFPIDEWRRVLSINLDGVFYCVRAELRHMLAAGGGAIVNMASMFSVVARDAYPAYTAAKHGVLGLTRAAAIDCVTRGVRVNAVGPAVIRTPLLTATIDQAGADFLASLNPSKRLGETWEVASIVAWLCSDEASFVTGAFYPVDGGFTAA